jgi:hypothetical protein
MRVAAAQHLEKYVLVLVCDPVAHAVQLNFVASGDKISGNDPIARRALPR